jgi:hypothetical protein
MRADHRKTCAAVGREKCRLSGTLSGGASHGGTQNLRRSQAGAHDSRELARAGATGRVACRVQETERERVA